VNEAKGKDRPHQQQQEQKKKSKEWLGATKITNQEYDIRQDHHAGYRLLDGSMGSSFMAWALESSFQQASRRSQ
jgi:hypothetical protein